MRVSFVVPTARIPIGGAGSLYNYANGLSRRGHDVLVVHVGYVTAPDGPTIWVDQPLRSIDELGWVRFERGVRHHVVEGLVDWSTLPDADILCLPGGSAPRRCGLPVMFIQGYGVLPELMDDANYRVAAPKFCIARWLVDVGLEKGVDERQLVYLPYGLDHDKYRSRTPLVERPAQVAMYYSDHPAKGAWYGLEALRQVHQRRPDARLLAFGNARPNQDIPAEVEFHQDPPQERLVDEIYAGSRVFLFPSVTEGFGFAPIEAMACGAALVTTHNGGSADYAFDGDTALVAPAGDPTALADRVVELLDDDERCARIARHGRQYVERFDWDFSAALLDRHLTAYLEQPARYGLEG